VLLPFALGVVLTLFFFFKVGDWEEDRRQFEFERRISSVAQNLIRSFDTNLETLASIRSFYDSSNVVDRSEFASFVSGALARREGIHALEWIPRVPLERRSEFEQSAQEEGLDSFGIRERVSGELVPASVRPEYFPVHFVEPFEGNEKALGYDLASDPVRLDALTRSRMTGAPTATQRIRLIQESGEEFGVLVFQPVHSSVEGGVPTLRGFALGVFLIGEMIHQALGAVDRKGLDIQLIDASSPIEERVLHTTRSGRGESASFEDRPGLAWEIPYRMADRAWLLRFTPSAASLPLHRSWSSWIVLGCGLALSLVLGAFLSSLTQRTRKVEALVRDKTAELTRSHNQLAKAEQHLGAVVDSVVDGIITIDARGRIESFNRAAERIFGFTSSEVVGQNVKILMPEPHASQHDGYLAAYERTGEAKIIGIGREVVGRRRDGSLFPLELSVSELRLDDTRAFVGLVRDITQRRESEEKLRQAALEATLFNEATVIAGEAESFEEAAERLLEIVGKLTGWPLGHVYLVAESGDELLPAGIWYRRDPGRFAEFVAVTQRTTFRVGAGLPGRILASQEPSWIVNVQDDPNFPRANLCDDTGLRGAFGFPIIIRGTVKAVLEFFSPERAEEDQRLLMLVRGVAEQAGRVLERKLAAEEVARANESLQKRNADLAEFTHVASHDLQEPLRKLISFSELLRADVGEDLSERAEQDLHFIDSAARRMKTLVEDLLALSRAGNRALKLGSIPLDECVDAALDALSIGLEEAGAVVCRCELPSVHGDRTSITQLYQNLIANALKFSTGTPRIELTIEDDEGVSVFGVRDDGIGIEPEYADQIFSPFKRLHRRDEYEGSGIGLSICRKAAERHGGRIWVTSRTGEGSHFRFTLAPQSGDPSAEPTSPAACLRPSSR
jgi:PAS domain S-box-containing protein